MKTLDSHELALATGGGNNPAVAALKAQIKDRVNQQLASVFADVGPSLGGAPGAPGMATAAPGMAAAAPGAPGMAAMTPAAMKP